MGPGGNRDGHTCPGGAVPVQRDGAGRAVRDHLRVQTLWAVVREPPFRQAESTSPQPFPAWPWSIPGFMHTWFCVTQLRHVALL